jgi:nucleoid-associated protein YgaU
MPFYVHAYWGRFSFRGILTQADVTYKLFDRAGEPLRATVKLALKEAMSPQEVAATENASSPDLFQTWLVRDGERLDVIAAQVYGDPAYWRPLARVNRLANPRGLVTGQQILLPPLAAR